MSITTRAARLAALSTGAVMLATLAGTAGAQASVVHIDGYSPVESCTGLTGSITYSPGLRKHKLHNQQSVLTGTLTGCSGPQGAQEGTGTVTLVLHGRSTLRSINETGTMTVNWPASSGLNPSNGPVSIVRDQPTDPISLSASFSSGAYTGAIVSSHLLVTQHQGRGSKAHPVVRQDFINTDPFVAKVNFG